MTRERDNRWEGKSEGKLSTSSSITDGAFLSDRLK